jgi:ribbon-helix-helix CopG family protein
MTFSVHVDDKLFRQIDLAAKEGGKTRNALIRQALQEWLSQHKPAAWPAKVLSFTGVKGAPRFERARSELKEPREPFDEVPA